MSALERKQAADAAAQHEYDDMMEEAQRAHLRPPVILKPLPSDPLAARRRAKAARRAVQGRKLSAADQERITRWVEADRVEGWKGMALILGRDEKTVRTAYQSDPRVRRVIHKTGGRYWADPMELWSGLAPVFADRRAAARQAHAIRQARATAGTFQKKAPPERG